MTGSDGVAWLLASKDPSVRYLTLTEVAGVSPRSGQARAARDRSTAGRSAWWTAWSASTPPGRGTGWRCAAHSSFHETIGPLWGWPSTRGPPGTRPPVRRPSGPRSCSWPTGCSGPTAPAGSRTRSGCSRTTPHTGTTTSSSSCSSWPLRQGRGPRAAEALDLVAAKRDADGRWRPGGRRYWCPPGSQGSNVEVVDWGRSGPNELLTLSALRVLRAAGRPPA
jgi:hypothetical protein